jgi:hypothetical protein
VDSGGVHVSRFTYRDPDPIDKSFPIYGPEDLIFNVDYDDVNHFVVEELTRVVVEHLNTIPDDTITTAVELGEARMRAHIAAEQERWRS